ncbi:MAG: fibronectin type III domain-containing protein [Bacteroidales bacterium]|nr:fibronectin type III domain-containing protein [Bacteroidales bacterium]MBR6883297.1 fibronectin type III domain-containing protein [Bacteroidales bacterium]
MKRFLTILALASLLASCGDKPEPEPEKHVPSTPTGLVVHSATDNGLTFQWETVQYATSYTWELQQAGAKVQEGTTKNRNAILTGLTKATDYRFGVKAVNEDGASSMAWIDARTTGTVDPDPPTPPTPSITYADFAIPSVEEDGVARAFPGAEGGGMYVTGGRGGKVIHVTNLNDKGAGSLRAAIEEKGARTIVFDVAGIIELQSALKVQNGDVTIAGQTAPGDGICLKNYNFRIHASNVIVRFIRCRMGDEKKTEDDAMNLYTGDNNLQDVIIDHCSLSWSTDECGTFYGMTNFSLQWCILSESLRNSVHGKGKHGYGGIWGGTNATYHHNLLAHHDSRNPRLDHDYVSTLKGPVSLVNNVIYNWGDNSTYGGESANDNNEYKKYNIVNNYYKPGPATAAGKVRFIDPWTKACDNCTKKTGSTTIVPGHFYMDGNVMDGYDGLTGDNWTGTTAAAAVIANIKSDAKFSYAEKATSLSLQKATDAYTAVMGYAGASFKRDQVDTRIARETKNGNYTYTGSNGSTNGFIDTQADVGGWPTYAATDDEVAKVKDTDGDGIPDAVEDAFGLDKASAADGAAKTLDKSGRYTNLEMYLHYLVKDIVTAQNQGGNYQQL